MLEETTKVSFLASEWIKQEIQRKESLVASFIAQSNSFHAKKGERTHYCLFWSDLTEVMTKV